MMVALLKGHSMRDSTVRLSFPAASGYLVLARTAVAALCARLDYPLDRLEDVKLAVDESCAWLLVDAAADATIELTLTSDSRGTMLIEVTTRTKHGRTPSQNSFAWTVLSALVDSVQASAQNGLVTISLHTRRDVSLSDASGAAGPSVVGA